jgi:1-deoxy-D-xylulose-5-phosphate synthase
VPFCDVVSTHKEDKTDYSILNKYEITTKGEKVCIIGLGNFYYLGEKVKTLIEKELGFTPTLINPKFITGLDKELLEDLKSNHKLVITLEDGILNGGFGEKISRFYGGSEVKTLNFGGDKVFTDRVPLSEQYEKYHLTPKLIVEDIKHCINI